MVRRTGLPFFQAPVCRFAAFVVLLCSYAVPALAETLRGRVVDPASRAVASAEVLVVQHGAVLTTTRTANDGQFGPITLDPGTYELFVSAQGLHAAPARVTLDRNGTATITVSMTVAAVQESVVVSAAQVDTPLSRATDAVSVIDRAQLDLRQTHTAADALRLVPGFGVVASGTPGGVTSIFPRGGESDYTLVLVDGIPQNTFGGAFDAAHLDTADVDRIEVVRGPDSALFGSDAIGGVVQVVTRQGGPLRGGFSFEGGGYGTSHASASAAGSRRAWRWGAALDRFRTDGDTRVFPSIGGPVSNDDYTRDSGSVSAGWSDRPTRSILVDVRAGRNERGNPGAYGSDPLGLYGGLETVSRTENRYREVGLSGVLGSTASLRHHAQFTWAGLTSHSTSSFGSFDDATHRVTGRYQLDFHVRSAGVSAGWEILHERANDTFITGESFEPVPVNRTVSGWFVEARPALGDRLFVTLGARLERIQRDALEADASAFNERPAFTNDVVWSPNPKASVAWLLRQSDSGNWTRLRAGAGTGIRPPNAFEIAFTDNPSLKPERSRSVDAGIEQAFAHAALVVDATWFANRFDDLIVTVGNSMTGVSRYRTDNIANASSHGLELAAAWRGPHGFSARTSWTLLHTEVLAVDHLPDVAPTSYYTVGGPLVRRPKRQGSAELDWSARRGTAFVAVNGRGAVADIEPNFGSTIFTNPGYAVVAVGGSVRLVHELELFGRVENLFNRAYEEVFGFPALGRSAFIGVRVAASR